MDRELAEQLVAALQPGRPLPTEVEIARLMAKVWSRAKWIPGCTPEELLQEAFVASFPNGAHPLRDGVDCIAHLHMVVHHLARDAVRRRTPHRLSFGHDPPEDATSPANRPMVQADEALEATRAMSELRDQLKPKDEIAWDILQASWDGMPPDEIREILGIDQAEYDAKIKKIRRTKVARELRSGG